MADVNTQVQNAASGPSRKKCKMEVQNWVDNVSRNVANFQSLQQQVEQSEMHHVPRRTTLTQQVERMTKELDELVEQSNFPGGLFFDDVHEYTGKLLLASHEINRPTLEQNLKEFWESFENVVSIGIYGMGGVGKTLMAKHINDKLVSERNIEVYWVTVSQDSNIRKLQDDIAKALKLEFSSESDTTIRAAELRWKFQAKRRAVVILDDVWEKIDAEGIGIPLGMGRCHLVITSRSKEVCRQMECQDIIQMKPLSDEEAWDLFLMKLGPTELSPRVKEMAQIVAKKCDGLPLAVITMAGSLKGVTDIYEWRDVVEELNESRMGQEGMKNDVFPILECSFNRLRDPKLQSCFLYCSLYPEDHVFQRERLISRFITEGLMNRTNRQANFDQGRAILNKLENACLLERCYNGYGVKMHDVIRDMALKITKGKYMVIQTQKWQLRDVLACNEWGEDLEKVSIMYNIYVREISPGISPPNCPRLSTLILTGCSRLKLIQDSFFDQMPSLHVLDLSETNIEKLPSSVSSLVKLNALLLEDCNNLRFVPPVGKLKELTELDIRYTPLKELPQGIENLINLKRLETCGSLIKTSPAGLLSRLSNLQRLALREYIEGQIEGLERLNQLEQFCGAFHNMHDFNRFIRGQHGNSKLNFYDILVGQEVLLDDFKEAFDYKLNRLSFREGSTEKRESYEDKIIIPSNVEKLDFRRSGLSGFLFDNFQQLNNNASGPIELNIVDEGEIIGIMRLLSEDEEQTVEGEEQWSCSIPLHRLKYLWLRELPSFHCLIFKREGIAVAPLPPGTFSQLKQLVIERCNKIKKLIPWFLVENFQNLQDLRVQECEQIEDIIGGDKKALVGESIATLPRLQTLNLEKLPALRRICRGEIICDSSDSFSQLKELWIERCNKIKRLIPWSLVNNLQNLQDFRVIGCEQIEEIFGDDKNKLSDMDAVVTFPRLWNIYLNKLPALWRICEGKMIFDSIQYITILRCQNLKKMPLDLPLLNGQLSPPPSLRKIEAKKEWWDSLEWEPFNEATTTVLQPFLEFKEE